MRISGSNPGVPRFDATQTRPAGGERKADADGARSGDRAAGSDAGSSDGAADAGDREAGGRTTLPPSWQSLGSPFVADGNPQRVPPIDVPSEPIPGGFRQPVLYGPEQPGEGSPAPGPVGAPELPASPFIADGNPRQVPPIDVPAPSTSPFVADGNPMQGPVNDPVAGPVQGPSPAPSLPARLESLLEALGALLDRLRATPPGSDAPANDKVDASDKVGRSGPAD